MWADSNAEGRVLTLLAVGLLSYRTSQDGEAAAIAVVTAALCSEAAVAVAMCSEARRVA